MFATFSEAISNTRLDMESSSADADHQLVVRLRLGGNAHSGKRPHDEGLILVLGRIRLLEPRCGERQLGVGGSAVESGPQPAHQNQGVVVTRAERPAVTLEIVHRRFVHAERDIKVRT